MGSDDHIERVPGQGDGRAWRLLRRAGDRRAVEGILAGSRAAKWRRRRSAEAGTGQAQSVTKAVVQFVVSGTAAVAILGFVAVQILQHTGQTEAIRDAKHETQLAGEGIVGPVISAGLLRGQPTAIAVLDNVVHRYVLHDPVTRVKIWDARGRIVYSDEHRLIGTTYVLGRDELAALRAGAVDAAVSDLAKPENRFERPLKKLLEVYIGITGPPGGQPLLYEEYLRYSSVAASGNRVWSSFGPALVLTFVLLELTQIPLAWSLARRLRRRQEERESLLRRAIEASEVERRQIARELHGGVVQNLAGVSYTLAAAATSLRTGAAANTSEVIDRAAAETRETIRALRALVLDIYPPALQRSGLAGGLSDLLAPLRARNVTAEVDLQPDLKLPADQEAVLYRVAQEALRNVVKHAHATHVRVRAARENGTVFLSVEDDGGGYIPGLARRADDKQHFGQRILDDLARDAGGRLTVESEPGAGTTVRIEVPVR